MSEEEYIISEMNKIFTPEVLNKLNDGLNKVIKQYHTPSDADMMYPISLCCEKKAETVSRYSIDPANAIKYKRFYLYCTGCLKHLDKSMQPKEPIKLHKNGSKTITPR